MVDTPEKIWAYHNGNSQTYLTAPNKFHNVEYVRADIAASHLAEARAERDTLAMHLEAKAILAERDNARLREALRETDCPRPCNHRPDDFSAGDCFDAGECGCGVRAALAGKE